MELDDLKKSWNALDERLKQDEIIDEGSVERLIQSSKLKAERSKRKLLRIEKLSLIAGFCMLFLVLSMRGTFDGNFDCISIYFTVILCLGLPWDIYTYRYLKKTDILEMPIVTVVKRITRFHQFFIWESYVAAALFFSIALIQGYMEDILHRPTGTLILFIITWCIGGYITLRIIKHFFYKKIKIIRKNIAELQELKQD